MGLSLQFVKEFVINNLHVVIHVILIVIMEIVEIVKNCWIKIVYVEKKLFKILNVKILLNVIHCVRKFYHVVIHVVKLVIQTVILFSKN